MKGLLIAWKDVKIRIRDIKGLMLLILMPIVLTAILGSALNGTINGDQRSMPKMVLAVYDGDAGEVSKPLVQDILQGESVRENVSVSSVSSEEEVKQLMQEGKADAGIVIPNHFSQDIRDGRLTHVEIVQNPDKQTISQIVDSMVASYTLRVSAVTVSVKALTKEFETPVSTATPVKGQGQEYEQGQGAANLHQAIADLQLAADTPQTEVMEQTEAGKSISGMQYYAAAMAAMFLLFNATVGAKSILHERATETLARMMSTPTQGSSILTGKFLGTLLFSFLQFAVFMEITKLLFGVDWGAWQQTLVLGMVYAGAVSGLSMMIAAIVASEQAADIVTGIGIQILAILGGSMVPVALFPEFLRKIALITPNTWALQGFLDIMTVTSWHNLLLPLLVLLTMGGAALVIGSARLRLR